MVHRTHNVDISTVETEKDYHVVERTEKHICSCLPRLDDVAQGSLYMFTIHREYLLDI